jgi:putative SOS response-associated peptidase YedK
MSRLFAVVCPAEEIATQFGVEGTVDTEVPSETIEGTTGLVVVERDGRRMLKSITWGMPRQSAEMRRDRAPPERLGLVADLTNPLWNRIVVDPRYRCLIPVSHFANPDGEPGKKTRTWFSSADGSLMAWAGFCRNSEEFGPVFAGMTAEANELIKPYNERMPALVRPNEY